MNIGTFGNETKTKIELFVKEMQNVLKEYDSNSDQFSNDIREILIDFQVSVLSCNDISTTLLNKTDEYNINQLEEELKSIGILPSIVDMGNNMYIINIVI